jgi:hypothetical protein
LVKGIIPKISKIGLPGKRAQALALIAKKLAKKWRRAGGYGTL